MEIRQLRTFKAVSTLLSFNRAAEHLNYAQSSVSAQIHALEEELGVRLFDRLGRGIRLTEAGERLTQYADKILDLADESRAEVSGTKEISGSLTIRIPESFGVHRLPRVIVRFVERHPGVELSFITCAHESLQRDLRKGITDLAFLLTESIQAAGLDSEVLGFESIVMVAAPDHPLARRKTVRTRDLEGETVLLSRVDCSYRRTLEHILDEAGVKPRNTHVYSSVETLKRCVIEGTGITILPRIAVKDSLAAGDLATLNWEEQDFEVALLMIWYRERWRSPALAAFMETAREVLKADYHRR
jgi:DNA-binding transcriptional LysR family regulator